jgi:hypothetical protein
MRVFDSMHRDTLGLWALVGISVSFRPRSVFEESGLFLPGWNCKDTAHRSSTDVEAAGDIRFTEAKAA